MDADDLVFRALVDPVRRLLLDTLLQRDGRTRRASPQGVDDPCSLRHVDPLQELQRVTGLVGLRCRASEAVARPSFGEGSQQAREVGSP